MGTFWRLLGDSGRSWGSSWPPLEGFWVLWGASRGPLGTFLAYICSIWVYPAVSGHNTQETNEMTTGDMHCFNAGQAECAKRLNPPHPAGVLNPYRSLKSHPCRVDSSTPPFSPPRAPRIARSRGRRCFFLSFFGLCWSDMSGHGFVYHFGRLWACFGPHFSPILDSFLVENWSWKRHSVFSMIF